MKQPSKDKRVLVIGGGRGIGQALAIFLAREGAKICVAARSENEITETCASINRETPNAAIPMRCDVSSTESTALATDKAISALGHLDAVIFAAGVYGPIGPIETNSVEEWASCININLVGAVRVIQAVVPHFKKRRTGKIILFSGGGQGAVPNFSAYTASKGGIWRLTETAAAELAPYGIFLNAIAPGNVNTKFLDDLLAAGPDKVGKDLYERSVKQQTDGGNSPFKAAELASYLISEASNGLYGKILSALWDDYRKFTNLEDLSKSDIFTVKRIITPAGGTRWD